MAVQENSMDLSQYKGTIRKCEYCRSEEVLLGRACTWCLGNFFLAHCTHCNGSGKVTSGSVWDGGRSNYTATCHPCGGKGVYPAREADYNRQQAAMAAGKGNGHANGNANGHGADATDATGMRSLPRAVGPMPNLNITRSSRK